MPRSISNQVQIGNMNTYTRAAVLQLYTDEKWLPSEASLLMDYYADIVSKRVLELGAGSGRLASVLYHRSNEYIATDINADMIATLSRVHPAVKAFVADARNLEQIADETVDTVIFSFNGLDSLNFEDRPLVLSEAYRVLVPGGAFIHSTHNLKFARSASYRPLLSTLISHPFEFFRRWTNRYRLVQLEYYSSQFALINDRSLQNGLLNVYISDEVHMTQLATAGFEVIATYDRRGRRYEGNLAPDDQWYCVVARK